MFNYVNVLLTKLFSVSCSETTWHIPAQISKGLKIQLLHLLLAEPVADSPAFQEGLHFFFFFTVFLVLLRRQTLWLEGSTWTGENRKPPYSISHKHNSPQWRGILKFTTQFVITQPGVALSTSLPRWAERPHGSNETVSKRNITAKLTHWPPLANLYG